MKYILVLFLFLKLSNTIQSQDIIVNDGNLPEAEFHVAINPVDTNNIILATMHGFNSQNGNFITIYYTQDYGETWQVSDFQGEHAGYDGAGDPVLAFDNEGNALLVNLSAQPSTFSVHTVLSKSEDGGATWTHVSTVVDSFSDKPWIATDHYESSPYIGNIYLPVIENEPKLYIIDNTYQTTQTLTIPVGNALPSVVVGKNGDVFTSVVDISGSENKVFVQYYSDGGTTEVHSTQIVSFPDYTFNAPDISNRFQPTAYLAIDNSGGNYDGRLYLSYTASETGNPDYFNVFITYSDDKGVTWTTPKVVHSDQQQEVQQFYSSTYVNDQGVLVIDWYDRKNYSNTNKLTDFYLGISYDGGDTFTELQLNTVSSDFDQVIPSEDFGIGEYHQLVATDNTTIAFWSDGRTNDGDLNIYMAKVSLNNPITGVEELSTISDKIAVSLLYPQPVLDQINIDIRLLEDTSLKFEIIDNNGRRIWNSNMTQYLAGKHTVTFPCNVPSGVYYIRIVSTKRGYIKTIKMIKS